MHKLKILSILVYIYIYTLSLSLYLWGNGKVLSLSSSFHNTLSVIKHRHIAERSLCSNNGQTNVLCDFINIDTEIKETYIYILRGIQLIIDIREIKYMKNEWQKMVRELFKSYNETKLNCNTVITISVTLTRAFYYFWLPFFLNYWYNLQ